MRTTLRSGARAVAGAAALFVALLAVPPVANASAAAVPDSAAAPSAAPPAALVVYGDTIVWFEATVAGIPPARRAEIAHDRIEPLRLDQMRLPVRAEPVENANMVLLGDQFMFMFLPPDSAAGPRTPGTSDLDQVEARLGAALRAQAKRLAPGQRLVAIGWTLLATLILVLLLRLLSWAHKLAHGWIERQSRTHRTSAKLGELDFLSHFTWLVTWLSRAALQVAAVVLFVIWAVFVLNRFPETRDVGAVARATLWGLLRSFQVHVVDAIPGIVGVAVIAFVARFVTRLSGDVFAGIERGTLRLPGIHPETARATRRLVTTSIWLFAVVVAYPMLPGSNSDAFKGVSVFLGLMVTLGSSGVMGHLMSGLVIVYSRSLQAGDVVRVNDIEGKVTEVGALSVKVINSRREEFTIPNAVIVGTMVKNYSRLCRDSGPALTTGVTIGYDAPWRVVHEMLIDAAERTSGVIKYPAPVVFQPELSDFYVVYQIMVRLEVEADRLAVLTELHQNIQDAFNERGVQIMSPHFEGQPDGRVWVPKSKWAVAPEDLPPGPRPKG
jgi:small-conductance mechanosensitive channel